MTHFMAGAVVDPWAGQFAFLWRDGAPTPHIISPPRAVAQCHRAALATRLLCWRFDQVSQGTIKKLTDKGFGFIQGDRGDIFFHSSCVEGEGFDSLREGQSVSYNEGQGPKGKRAENVRVIEG
jgi:cold shock protein